MQLVQQTPWEEQVHALVLSATITSLVKPVPLGQTSPPPV
jgi:hypothetical protein